MNKKINLVTLLALFGAVLLLAGCTNDADPAPSDPVSSDEEVTSEDVIVGIVWEMFSITDQASGESSVIDNPENYTIVFNLDGTLNGNADCNNFSGTYTQESGFDITIGATTRVACGEGSLGQQYLDLLDEVVAGGPDGLGGLALETAGGAQRLVFEDGGPASTQ